MNKSIIALAVAGLMAAPMAAQADVTVYGKAHVSIDFMSYDDDAKEDNTVLASNSSRWGIKGSEDLGGGLKAIYKIETGVAVDGEASGFTKRNRYLGLQGGWGTLLGGIHDTPMKGIGRKVELFPEYLGDFRNISSGWDARVPNVVVYQSPTFGNGFGFDAAYTFDWQGSQGTAIAGTADPNTDNNDYTALSASVDWKSGNWYVGLAYEAHDVPAAESGLPNDETESGIRAVAKWTPGAWMLTALYHSTSGVTSTADFDMMGIGAGYKMGKNVIKAQYYMKDANFDNGDSTLAAVGWDYKFSKRTTAYLAYAVTDNEDAANRPVNCGGHGDCQVSSGGSVTPGTDPSGISVGMIHNF